MLTVFRRHLKDRRFKSKGRKHRHCNCPLSVEGMLLGTMMRKSLDIRGWDAAQKLVRDWEAGAGQPEIPSVDDAMGRFIDDQVSRGMSADTIRKWERMRDELVARFPAVRIDRVTTDELGKYKESWKLKPSTAIKKLERLRSFFKLCVERDWIAKNPAKALKAPKEISLVVKPYDQSELEKIAWAIPLFPSKGFTGSRMSNE